MAKKNFFKTTSKVVGTLAMALVLVFGLVLAGCPTDDSTSDPNPDQQGGEPLHSIMVYNRPTKYAYNQGEALDTAGIIVKAYYGENDYSGEEVTGFTTEPANGAALNTPGVQHVTVSYTKGGVTKTGTFDVGVLETITKQSFTAGTWGSETIPTSGNNDGMQGVLTVTETGGTLVFTERYNFGTSASPNYSNISTTLTFTWDDPMTR